jgi:hypothetical protein
VYEAADGKAEAMKARFKNEVVKRFPNHGIELLGVSEEPSDAARLTSIAARSGRLSAPIGKWRAVKAATEAGGPPLKQQAVTVLSPALADLSLK